MVVWALQDGGFSDPPLSYLILSYLILSYNNYNNPNFNSDHP